ncbi:ribonuclease H-like domain-containing protein [Tanacetum coccineum]
MLPTIGFFAHSGANQHNTSSTNNMTDVIDISDLNITVGHPNGIAAKIRKVENLKLTSNIDLKKENVPGTGSKAGGLYVFNTKSSSPNDDGGEPSRSNIGSESQANDTAKEVSFDDDQESVEIGEEDFYKGYIFENNEVPTHLFNTKESSTLRRSSRKSKLPPKLNDYVLNSKARYGLDKFFNHTWLSAKNYCFIANINKIFEPKSYEEAALDKNWVQAMYEEMYALCKNNTWVLVELPRNRKAIGSKCLISLAVHNGWCLFQLDVNNAFLYGNLDEDAPRQWNNRLSEGLIETGFKQSGNDHSLYTKESGGNFVALLVYDDDIVLTGNNIDEINYVKIFLSSKFNIKDLSELKYFLGIEVLKSDKGGLCLSQRKYCLELLYDYGLLTCKHVSTPLPENIVLAHKEIKGDKFLKNVTSYQRLVGKLIYLTHTRANISYFVHCLSQYMHAPLQSHMDFGLRILRYLKGAPESGVDFEKSKHMSLKVYADSDWAKCPVIRRPVSGYCVFYYGCLVTWISKKQATLSKSSAEAEYRSIATTTCESMWIVNILKDLKVTNLLPAVVL